MGADGGLVGQRIGHLKPERSRFPGPKGIDAIDLLALDRIADRPRANAVDVAAAIDQAACGFDSQFRGWMLDDAFLPTPSILDVPRHYTAGSAYAVGSGNTVLLPRHSPPTYSLPERAQCSNVATPLLQRLRTYSSS